MEEGLHEKLLAIWKAERDSRPTVKERELWPRTIVDLELRLKVEMDAAIRSDLFYRLAMANIKMEDYSAALDRAEKGLEVAVPEWTPQLLELKAQAMYLSGREEEALSILDQLRPMMEVAVPSASAGASAPAPMDEVVFDLLCPVCLDHVSYGSTRCPNCGTKVNEQFRLVRSTYTAGSVKVTPEKVEPGHRTKEFNFLFTTHWVDYDDPENFVNSQTLRILGGETITHVSRDWYMSISIITLIFINVAFGLWTLAEFNSADGNGWFMMMFWAIVVVPFVLYFLWVISPPLPASEE